VQIASSEVMLNWHPMVSGQTIMVYSTFLKV
jgi:hypothetical protein